MDTYNDSKEASRKHIACSASGRASNVRGGAGHERDAAEAEASEARRVNGPTSTAQCEMPPARTASVRVSILSLSLATARVVGVYVRPTGTPPCAQYDWIYCATGARWRAPISQRSAPGSSREFILLRCSPAVQYLLCVHIDARAGNSTAIHWNFAIQIGYDSGRIRTCVWEPV